eukprot:GHVN01055247.1.p1 GENE.GHVN01055247.1~~GHVN01055247.1.p1  ORF type:complete len:732 (+),score=75.43 GHVN01055247.1:63-2198(+)
METIAPVDPLSWQVAAASTAVLIPVGWYAGNFVVGKKLLPVWNKFVAGFMGVCLVTLVVSAGFNDLTTLSIDQSNLSASCRTALLGFCLLKIVLLLERFVLLGAGIQPSKDHFLYTSTGAAFSCFALGYGAKQLHWFAGMTMVIDTLSHLCPIGVGLVGTEMKKQSEDAVSTPSSIWVHLLHGFKCSLMGVIFVLSTVVMYRDDVVSTTQLYWGSQLHAIFTYFVLFLCLTNYVAHCLKEWRPVMAPLIPVFHGFAVVGVVKCWYHPQGGRLFLEAFVLYLLSGFGITCGAHRLWAHRAYEAAWPFRFVLLMFNSLACQGNIYHWARDHRVHHLYSEKLPDPHNAAYGFWYAHCGWLMLKKEPEVSKAGAKVDCSDLLTDPFVRLQKNLDPYWNLSFSFLLPALYGYYRWDSFWLGFFVHGCLRWIICLHATWCVNSAAHIWGPRTYTPDIGPSENLFTAVVAVGEGWHNWHHTYGFDYATSEHGASVQWNPSKVVLDMAYHMGLVWGRRRATPLWEKVKGMREKEREEVERAKLGRDSCGVVVPSRGEYASAIPIHCHESGYLRPWMTLGRDVILSCLVAAATIYSINTQWASSSTSARSLIFLVYALAQGTLWCSFWVVGYECAGGRFSPIRWVNHLMGCLLNTLLLVPYRPRRWSREHEQGRAGVKVSVKEDVFAVLKPWEFFSYPFCPFIAITFVVKMIGLTRTCGM